MFTLVYLVLTTNSKTNTLLKALALSYCLCLCYFFTFLSGACLNPALGLSESLYMIFYDVSNRRDPYREIPRYSCLWIYVLGPFIGALIAAGAFKYQKEVSEAVEQEEEERHKQKQNESRTKEMIDVEDTRSVGQTRIETE